MLPKDLENIFDNYADDEYSIYINKAEYSQENFVIDFNIIFQGYVEGPGSQKWTINTIGYKKNNISFAFASFIEIRDDHPLLWEFTDTQCELYFTGVCGNPEKLFCDLYMTHRKIFDKHDSLNLYFSDYTELIKSFHYSNGLLAKGSRKLMEMYADCLKRNGLDFTIIGDRPPTYWNGNQFILESPDLKILLIGGTYIIAENFSFIQHDKDRI